MDRTSKKCTQAQRELGYDFTMLSAALDRAKCAFVDVLDHLPAAERDAKAVKHVTALVARFVRQADLCATTIKADIAAMERAAAGMPLDA